LFHRFSILILLIAVGVQALPLRVCAVEQALSGQSCHDVGASVNGAACAAAPGLDGHAGDRPCDANCRCEMPSGQLNRHIPSTAQLDLLPASVAVLDLHLSRANLTKALPPCSPPGTATSTVILPLLT
jgi:hypothetical protein